MARLPQLIDALVQVTSREQSFVHHVARTLRDAGIIPPSKRGVGAARMTPADAANLLIALSASDLASQAVNAVKRYRALFTPEGESFGDYLEGLIRDGRKRGEELHKIVRDRYPNFPEGASAEAELDVVHLFLFEIEISRPFPSVVVSQCKSTTEPTALTDWRKNTDRKIFSVSHRLLEEGFYDHPGADDWRIDVRFGMRTIWALHDVLNVSEADDTPLSAA